MLEMGKDLRLLQKSTKVWATRSTCFTKIDKEPQLKDSKIMLISNTIKVIVECGVRKEFCQEPHNSDGIIFFIFFYFWYRKKMDS
jgi:hypothetical protein